MERQSDGSELILAGLYPFKQDAFAVSARAGLRTIQIAFQDKALTNWFYILNEADLEDKLDALLKAALQDYPEDIGLNAAKEGIPIKSATGELLDSKDKWKDTSDDSGAMYEKILGKESTLLDIAYLEIGLLRAKSVVRIELEDGSCGTGFLIDNNYIITNNHVIPDKATAKTCQVQFNFQRNADGRDLKTESYSLDPGAGFATSDKTAHDWTAVKLAKDANAKWGSLALAKNETEKNRHVTIIQHPNGLYKQIAIHHNFVRYVDEEVIQYLTDTQPDLPGRLSLMMNGILSLYIIPAGTSASPERKG